MQYSHSPLIADRRMLDASQPSTVQRLFELRVAERPNAVAITTPDGDWTYRELNTLANRIANRLRRHGIAPGEFVAISALRSPQTIAGLLGILKTGAAYVPLDSSYPDERLRFMLDDTKTRCLLADAVSARRLERSLPEGCSLLLLEDMAAESATFESYAGASSDLHSILYTSGSTGAPKGVMIVHAAIQRLVIDPDYVSIGAEDVFSHLAPFSFDTSLFEIFGALLNGARVMVLPSSVTNLSELADAVRRFQVTMMWLTSGLFSALIDTCPEFVRDLRYLLVGGDFMSVAHARKALSLMRRGHLLNCYGPTESTTFNTTHCVTPGDLGGSAIPIGKPIRGDGAWLLNDKLQLVQGSDEGEIYVTGLGLARGYWNRPELTATRFFDIETAPGRIERAYKTGDLGRYRPDGTIDIIGRIDLQVKVRGFRIELTEIETRMAECDAIASAVVVPVVTGGAEDKHLRLCYVLKKGAQFTPSQAEAFLRERLPAHAVPSEYVVMDALPLDPNGKIHRRKLSQMQLATSAPGSTAGEPLSEVAAELLGRMRELLKAPHLTPDDDFFMMGGHSLLAARLFSKIESRWKRRLPLALMLQVRTARRLAEAVEASENQQPAWSSLVPLRTGGTGTPVFLLHAIGGNVIGYRDLALLLPEDVPVYGIQAKGLDGVAAFPDTVEQMAAEYIDLIRSVQPEGPYVLCGFSAGGVMAFEVAAQLESAGQSVALIGLIDSNLATSVLGTMRTRGIGPGLAQGYHILLWNCWYATQIGIGTFLAKKIRNTFLNLRISVVSVLNRLSGGSKTKRLRFSVEEAFLKALRRYQPGTVRANAILFRTADSELYDPDQEAAWRRVLAGSLEVCTVTGTHDNMLEQPNVNMLMASFVSALNGAQAPSPVPFQRTSAGKLSPAAVVRGI